MKTIFNSRYTDKKVTVAQYLAELICERQAKKDKVELPQQFWAKPKWRRSFLYQVQVANGLLKLYKPEAIIAALRKNPQIYSLNAKFLDPLIQAEQEALEKKEQALQTKIKNEVVSTQALPETRQPFTGKKSPINRLRDL